MIVIEGVYWMNPQVSVTGCRCDCGVRFAVPAFKIFARCPNCNAVAQTLHVLPSDDGRAIHGADCMGIF